MTSDNIDVPYLVLISIIEVNEVLGQEKTETYLNEAAGEITERLKQGRSTRWPRHEIQAIAAARIARATRDELRVLVKALMARRPEIFQYWRATALSVAA